MPDTPLCAGGQYRGTAFYAGAASGAFEGKSAIFVYDLGSKGAWRVERMRAAE
jgi:hypothetical protein